MLSARKKAGGQLGGGLPQLEAMDAFVQILEVRAWRGVEFSLEFMGSRV